MPHLIELRLWPIPITYHSLILITYRIIWRVKCNIPLRIEDYKYFLLFYFFSIFCGSMCFKLTFTDFGEIVWIGLDIFNAQKVKNKKKPRKQNYQLKKNLCIFSDYNANGLCMHFG